MKIQTLGSFCPFLSLPFFSRFFPRLTIPLPIRLDGSTTQSFITPQRGGLTIYNPSSFHPPSLDSSFQTFSHQFRQLIGLLPDSRPGGIGNLIETRSRESLRDALDTLGDLVRLVEEQPNMSVTKTVQIRVLEALDLLDKVRLTLSPSLSLALANVFSLCLNSGSHTYYHRIDHSHFSRSTISKPSLFRSVHATPSLLPSGTQVRSVHAVVWTRRCTARGRVTEGVKGVERGEEEEEGGVEGEGRGEGSESRLT